MKFKEITKDKLKRKYEFTLKASDLNKEVDQDFEDSVYLTTVHGSKGLEWEYVYIIDMDNKNFPAIMPKFFIDELVKKIINFLFLFPVILSKLPVLSQFLKFL